MILLKERPILYLILFLLPPLHQSSRYNYLPQHSSSSTSCNESTESTVLLHCSAMYHYCFFLFNNSNFWVVKTELWNDNCINAIINQATCHDEMAMDLQPPPSLCTITRWLLLFCHKTARILSFQSHAKRLTYTSRTSTANSRFLRVSHLEVRKLATR